MSFKISSQKAGFEGGVKGRRCCVPQGAGEGRASPVAAKGTGPKTNRVCVCGRVQGYV